MHLPPSGVTAMELYFAPGACSLASHIALIEAGLPFELKKVDTKTKKLADGGDYYAITSKGYVPALRLDNGHVLTEGTAIMPFIADQSKGTKLAPAAGTLARARLHEWLGYLNSEFHKSFGPLFNPAANDEVKKFALENVTKRLDFLEKELAGREHLLDDGFSVADGYLFTLLGWTRYVKIDLSKWPTLAAYATRIGARPAVQAAMKAEGLIK